MGDKVRLMLEFNLETFLKCGPPKTNMVRKYFLLSMSRQVRLVEESLIRLSDVSSYVQITFFYCGISAKQTDMMS